MKRSTTTQPDRAALVRECKAMRARRSCQHECSFFHPADAKGYPAFCKGAMTTGRQ